MSFIYYKRSKKEKITILEIFPEGRCAQSDFCTHCENLAHLANFGTPCEFDDFALRNALFPSILLLIVLASPCQVWQRVLKCSKARVLHVLQTLPQSWPVSMIKKLPKTIKLTKNWLVTIARFLTCQMRYKGLTTTKKCSIQLSLSL